MEIDFKRRRIKRAPAEDPRGQLGLLQPSARRRAISERHHLYRGACYHLACHRRIAASCASVDPNVRLEVLDRECISADRHGHALHADIPGIRYVCLSTVHPTTRTRAPEAYSRTPLQSGFQLSNQGLPFRLITDQANATPARLSSTAPPRFETRAFRHKPTDVARTRNTVFTQAYADENSMSFSNGYLALLEPRMARST